MSENKKAYNCGKRVQRKKPGNVKIFQLVVIEADTC